MGRHLILALAAGLLLASCGPRSFSPPSNVENACTIARERPHYMRAMRAAERTWGVPVPVQMATIVAESSFVGNARTPHRFALGVIPVGRQSTAFGYAQALDGTWDDYVRETGNRRARRDNIADATDFMGWYMNWTVRRNGIPLTDARNQYLAYHEGHAGFSRGSYREKAWLIRVADNVAARAARFESQLVSCRMA